MTLNDISNGPQGTLWAVFAFVFLAVVLADVVTMIVLVNTICKK